MVDNKKTMQLELLMEKLRHKTSNLNLADSAKAFRMTLLEKRYANDVVEKSQYQKCLDLLQTNMKVTSLQSMLERLESISRQSGLKFTADGSGRAFFISSDMFYLEVIVEQSGAVREVHIQHEGRSEPHTCNEIATCLNSGNFTKFTSHLQGLCAIYQVSADKKLKSKAFAALSALEMDLNSMSKLLFNNNQDVASLVHKSPLGIVVQRVGGQPLTMTYFISPYDLLNCQSPNIKLVIEKIMDKKLGISCTVGIDSFTNVQLPTQALLSVTRNSEGESVPTFSTLNANNSMSLPATFVLRIGEPLILCKTYANQIRSITGVEVGCWDHPEYLFSSLVKKISHGQIELTYDGPLITKALRVILPDQSHSYYVTESEEVTVKCCSISSVSFTHPSQVPQILSILRRQAILSTLLSSCIRPRSQSDTSQSISFEINAITLDHLAVSFEHPVLEKMCCLEIDLGLDPSCIQCCLYITEEEVSMANNEFATKVLQKCFSIPVTMRALLRQMQATSSRFSTSTIDHSGPFERRFNPQLNGGDLDSHSSSNGQYGPSSLTGGAGSGSGSFDRGHSPRTHSSGNGSGGIDSTIMHSSTPKEVGSVEMENSEEVSLIDEAIGFADKNKTGFGSQSSEAWTSLQANPDISLANSADSGLGLSLSSTAFQMVPNQNARDATDTKSDESPEMDTSMLETDLGDVLPGTEGDDDAQDLSPIEAEPRSQKGETKLGVYPSVSITPVTSLLSSSQSTSYHNITLERRPGIEIIPFGGKDPSSSGIPSSLTITPVGTKAPKEKSSKYKEFRLSGEGHSNDAEKKERKRRREDDKTSSPSSGDKPNKMVCVNSTLMGPPSVLKADASPKRSNSSSSQGTNSISPMASPSRSSSKSSTPSSSPKHLSPGGKPSMSTLSMSAFKPANSPLAGSLSPSNSTSSSSSSKSKKSRDRDRERSEKDRDRDKDRDRNRSRERSRDREKKSRTPTPTSSSNMAGVSSRGPALVKTKSLDFSPSLKDDANDDKDDIVFNSLFGPDPPESDAVPAHIDPSAGSQEVRSLSPAPGGSNLGSLYDTTSLTGGNKSPNRCRKSSLSAVIDKLRLQHNPETDVFQTGGGGPKYSADLHTMKMENDNNDSKNLSDSKSNSRLEGRSGFIEDYEEDKSDSSRSPKANETEEGVHFDRMDSESNSPNDPFSQDDSGINETVDSHGGEMNGDSLNKEFARPFPPPSSRSSYRYRSGDATDLNPNSPSVSVHIVNVPSPLALQQTRSPLANQLALVSTASAGASPASSTSQSSPCVIDDDLMDEVLKL